VNAKLTYLPARNQIKTKKNGKSIPEGGEKRKEIQDYYLNYSQKLIGLGKGH